MASPAARILRLWKYNVFVRRLTFLVLAIVAAVLYSCAVPIKLVLCSADLPRAQFALQLASFQTAQSIICSEKDILPKPNGWNLSYHQGGNGPWIPKVDGVINDDLTLPPGCVVDQVNMLARHAERYPTNDTGQRHLDLLSRLKASPIPVSKSLAFVKDWTYFTTAGSPDFESLIRSGRYPGTTAAWHTGSLLRSRYPNLIIPNQSTNFWSASSPRDIETAEWFAKGFFGPKWNESGAAVLEIIPETAERGANTLTPGKSCSDYQSDFAYGRPCGYKALDLWQRTFTVPISTRLEPSAPGFNFSAVDIYSMFEMCGFEIMVRGVSPWCNIFTNTDWEDFEYGRDLLHYYRAGPGNKYAGAMGFLWLDATTRNILNQTSAAKRLYASFVHDGDIIPLIATLGLLDEAIDPHTHKPALLPSQHRMWDRKWRTSDIVPMGGRVVFERITCDKALHPVQHRRFVRLLINDGHIRLGDRPGGLLGYDMTVEEFEDMVAERRLEFGDFRGVCGLRKDGPAGIDFLHQ